MFLAYNKYGSPIEALSKAFMSCRYYPTTEFGVSPKYDSNSHQDPLCGPGQVSLDGPCAQVHVCVRTIKLYNKVSNSSQYTGARKTFIWRSSLGRFMDDVTLRHMYDLVASK